MNQYDTAQPRWREVSLQLQSRLQPTKTASAREPFAPITDFGLYGQLDMYKYAGFWDKAKSIGKGVGKAGLMIGDMALWLNPVTMPWRLGAEVAYRGGKGMYHLARGEKKKALAVFFDKIPGAPKVVPESDPRPAMDAGAEAEKDFADYKREGEKA